MKKLPLAQSSRPVVEEPDPVAEPSLHLVGVHDGVDAPNVLAIHLDRPQAGVLGAVVVPGLLEAEGVHAEDRAEVLVVLAPGGEGPADAIPEREGVGGEEVDLMPDRQGERVPRVGARQLAEDPSGTLHVSGQPGVDGRVVHALARAEAVPVGVRAVSRPPAAERDRVLGVGGEQPQVRAERHPHRKRRIVRDCRSRLVDTALPEMQQLVDGPVVVPHRLLARGPELEPVLVDVHRRPP